MASLLFSSKLLKIPFPSFLFTDNLDALKFTEFPTEDGHLTLFYGETVNLTCSGRTTRRLTQLNWHYNNNNRGICPVREDPFCVPSNQTLCGQPIYNGGCIIDVRGGRRCKTSRVYSYVYSTVEDCVYLIQRKNAILVINGVTWSDSGIYTCKPTNAMRDDDNIKTMNVTVGQLTSYNAITQVANIKGVNLFVNTEDLYQ